MQGHKSLVSAPADRYSVLQLELQEETKNKQKATFAKGHFANATFKHNNALCFLHAFNNES